jgi:hypothetical protein
MSKISELNMSDGILSYTLKTGRETKINFAKLIATIGNIEYQNIYFTGGFNIVLFVKIKENERALRISIEPIKKENFKNFKKEINMMYFLKEKDIGIEVYFPEKDKINDTMIIENCSGGHHTISIIEWCKNGSMYDYITNPEHKLLDKQNKINELFDKVEKLFENHIYCSDIKFRNFVVNNDGNVKIIDVSDCNSLVVKKDKDVEEEKDKDVEEEKDKIVVTTKDIVEYKLIYKTLIYIQIFHNCPDILSMHFVNNLSKDEIYTTYTKLHDGGDKIYSNEIYLKLLRNIFHYYHNTGKIKVYYENIKDHIVNGLSDFELRYIYRSPKEIFGKKIDTKYMKYIKYHLFLVFLNVIKYFKDDDIKNTFFNQYKYKVDEPEKIVKRYVESPENCVVLDGKQIQMKRKSLRKRKSLKKSLRKRKSLRKK